MRGTALLAIAMTCALAHADDSHILVAVQGKVTIKRKGWTTTAPAGFGTILRRGDLVRLVTPARATVACADLSVHELPAGQVSGVPCVAAQKSILVYEGSLLSPTRGDGDAQIPVVIAPRRTKLLSPRPVLRWAAMPGITRYKVAVRGPGMSWSADVDGATSLPWPAAAPAFTPEATYKVTVTAGGHSSDELSEPGLGFSVLGADAASQLRAQTERLRTRGLQSAAVELLTAHLYASRGLHAEAIELLEALAKSQPAPRVWQMLGSLYQEIGVTRLAEERYLEAAKQALAGGDIEGHAHAQRALGILYSDAFGLHADAKSAFTAALASFEKLGDAAAVNEVKERLGHAQSP